MGQGRRVGNVLLGLGLLTVAAGGVMSGLVYDDAEGCQRDPTCDEPTYGPTAIFTGLIVAGAGAVMALLGIVVRAFARAPRKEPPSSPLPPLERP